MLFFTIRLFFFLSLSFNLAIFKMIVFMYLNYVEHGVAFMSKYEFTKKMATKRKIQIDSVTLYGTF